jgi:hypothetical protein
MAEHCTYGNFRSLHHTKHVAIEGPVEVVHGRLTPTSGMETPLSAKAMSAEKTYHKSRMMSSPWRYGSVQTPYPQIRITGWWAETLHGYEPGRRCQWRNRQRLDKLV